MASKYVLVYESAEDVLETTPQHFAAHRAHWETFRSDGSLLLIGTFADPRDGAMAVFRHPRGGRVVREYGSVRPRGRRPSLAPARVERGNRHALTDVALHVRQTQCRRETAAPLAASIRGS